MLSDEELRVVCMTAGFRGDELQTLLTLCATRSSSMEDEEAEAAGAGGRSVRTL